MKKIFSVVIAMFLLPCILFASGCGASHKDSTGGKTPKEFVYEISRDGKYIYFGEYPQSIKADNVTIISQTPDANGYYNGSDGAKYYKYTLKRKDNCYYSENDIYDLNLTKASNGTIMQLGQDYYFKVEKLKWRILSKKNGKALIVCDNVINSTAYQPYFEQDCDTDECYVTDDEGNWVCEEDGTTKVSANNYKYSELRRFLTQDFYSTAFSSKQKAMISLTEVDNSAETTNNPTNRYSCENTNDYVFALSYADVINPEYGFNANANSQDLARRWYNTDFAKATISVTITEEYVVNFLGFEEGSDTYNYYMSSFDTAIPWLRSPDSYFSNCGSVISYCYPFDNEGLNSSIDAVVNGVLPALQINI